MHNYFVKAIFLISSIIFAFDVTGQRWILQQADKEFVERMSGGLKVGDTMPDIPLGKVINNYTEKTKFSDFKGKLLILDFWGTNCTSCIEGFPKMEKLQEQFGNQIQIILVNKYETIDEIEHIFKTRNEIVQKSGRGSIYKLPKLPIIVLDKKLPDTNPEDVMKAFKRSSNYVIDTLFPIRGIPHHVWIDGHGVIRVRGGSETTHARKIKELLGGKEFFSKNDDNTTIRVLDGNWPYFKIVGHIKDVPVKLSSFVTPFNNQYAANSGGYSRNIIDSGNQTRRNTFINWEVLRIYYFGPFAKFFQNAGKNIFLSPPNAFAYKLFDLQVKDTLRYTTSFVRNQFSHLTDWDDIRSKICYEQIVPVNMSEDERLNMMLLDLNRYLKQEYSAEVKKEKKRILCYVLKRTSEKDKIKSTTSEYKIPEYFVSKGLKMYKFSNTELSRCFLLSAQKSPLEQSLLDNRKSGQPFLLLNETGFTSDKKVSMILPCGEDLKSIEQLRGVLMQYDLDIQIQERDIEFVVIKENHI
jgi:thiol-disulfide isomerase/thioredoxin